MKRKRLGYGVTLGIGVLPASGEMIGESVPAPVNTQRVSLLSNYEGDMCTMTMRLRRKKCQRDNVKEEPECHSFLEGRI